MARYGEKVLAARSDSPVRSLGLLAAVSACLIGWGPLLRSVDEPDAPRSRVRSSEAAAVVVLGSGTISTLASTTSWQSLDS